MPLPIHTFAVKSTAGTVTVINHPDEDSVIGAFEVEYRAEDVPELIALLQLAAQHALSEAPPEATVIQLFPHKHEGDHA
jgi:hypothetical protein